MKTALAVYNLIASFVVFCGLLFIAATAMDYSETKWVWSDPDLTLRLINGLTACWILACVVMTDLCKKHQHTFGPSDMHPIFAPATIGAVYGYPAAYQMWNHLHSVSIVVMVFAPIAASLLSSAALQRRDERNRVSVKQ